MVRKQNDTNLEGAEGFCEKTVEKWSRNRIEQLAEHVQE